MKIFSKLVIFVLIMIIFGGISILHHSFVKTYQYDDQFVIGLNDTTSDLVINLSANGSDINYYHARLIQKLFDLKLQSGTYLFNEPLTLHQLLAAIDQGEGRIPGASLVIPDGFSNSKILTRLNDLVAENESLSEFSIDEFTQLINGREGYLYPDTYFIYPETTATELFNQIEDNFIAKTASFTPALTYEELIMASILEREVSDPKDRRLVADILQRRLDQGMLLQVDATLGYYLGKTSAEISLDDLRADHPYNTYVRLGLPPTPIANPGIDAMQAVRDPLPNEYLFYLSDNNGVTYYARTYEGHLDNKERYLD